MNDNTSTAAHVVNAWELEPTDSHASFYGKAYFLAMSDGSCVLRSYQTNVAYIDAAGAFHRLWYGYSATTMRHINAFVTTHVGTHDGGKQWWESLPVEDAPAGIRDAAPAKQRKYRADYYQGYNAGRLYW